MNFDSCPTKKPKPFGFGLFCWNLFPLLGFDFFRIGFLSIIDVKEGCDGKHDHTEEVHNKGRGTGVHGTDGILVALVKLGEPESTHQIGSRIEDKDETDTGEDSGDKKRKIAKQAILHLGSQESRKKDAEDGNDREGDDQRKLIDAESKVA